MPRKRPVSAALLLRQLKAAHLWAGVAGLSSRPRIAGVRPLTWANSGLPCFLGRPTDSGAGRAAASGRLRLRTQRQVNKRTYRDLSQLQRIQSQFDGLGTPPQLGSDMFKTLPICMSCKQ